MYKIKQL